MQFHADVKKRREWGFDKGIDAYNREQEILKSNSEALYSGSPVLESGNSELFVIDILSLDEQES